MYKVNDLCESTLDMYFAVVGSHTRPSHDFTRSDIDIAIQQKSKKFPSTICVRYSISFLLALL